jgi:hypothetical protein
VIGIQRGRGIFISAMNFERVIKEVVGAFEAAGVNYALIGGFAMGLRGYQRATVDLDFILMLDDLAKADAILEKFHYVRVFRSENVSHYSSSDGDWGRIDVLHAFRGPSLGMLKRAEPIVVGSNLRLRVAQREDLIGLKLQALKNDPSRSIREWDDICALIQTATGQVLDWELIGDYLRLFSLDEKLPNLKKIHGEIKR